MAKRTGEKYHSILEAAVRVIAEQGYHKAQVARIAKESGVADGTIYLYFANKDDILISLFRKMMSQFLQRLKGKLDECNSAEEKLRKLIATHFDLMMEDRNLAVVTQIELRQPKPEVQREIGKVLKSYFNFMDELIAEGMTQGVFSPETDVRLARKVMFGSMDQMVTAWVLQGAGYDLTSQVEPLWRFVLYGLKGE